MHLVLDTETTGKLVKGATPFDPRQPWLMELGAVLLDADFNEVDNFVMLCKLPANVTVEEGAFQAHGLTAAHCNTLGDEPAEARAKFSTFVARAQYVWAYNMAFDAQILLGACIRARLPYVLQTAKTLCAMELMTPHCKIPAPWGGGYKWPKLQVAHVHATGREFDGAHSALADVRATGRVIAWLSKQDNWPLKGAAPICPAPRSGRPGMGATVLEGGVGTSTGGPTHIGVDLANGPDQSVRQTFSIPIAHIQTR